jgi:hypothetical protein
MQIAIRIFRGLTGITGIVQLVLGVLLWTGNARHLLPLHMLNGMIFVVALWILAVLCARAGAPIGLAVLAVVWGAVVPALGMTQARILPGPAHWVVQVTHLLTGIVAMGLADALNARARAAARSRRRAMRPPLLANPPAERA